MIKTQKFGTLIGLFIMAAGLFSCNDDPSVVEFEVIGDVFVNKRMQGDTEVYANSYNVSANQAISVAKVQTPSGAQIVLEALDGTSQFWAANEEYSSSLPEEGNYQFNILFQDVPKQDVDILVFDDLEFPVITNAEMSTGTLTVEWDEDEAQAHLIRLINEDGDIVFWTSFIGTQNTQLEISPSSQTGTWLSGYPNNEDVYTLELHGYLFVSESNIQEAAITEQEITWE